MSEKTLIQIIRERIKKENTRQPVNPDNITTYQQLLKRIKNATKYNSINRPS